MLAQATVAYDVLVFYGAMAVWTALLGFGIKRKSYWPFLGFGLLVALVLNVRYFIDGQADSIAFFIGIYDTFDNLGLASNESAPALASCADNACSVWGDRYTRHPSWGVAFYDRFASGPALRQNLLYAHIFFNTIAFVLLHYQLLRPGTTANRDRHRRIGRVSFAAITAGTVFAIWMASQHATVGEYGGVWSMFGFYSMSAFVYGSAVMSVVSIRSRDQAAHRIWSIRYAGAMWGAFWLFRVMLVVTGPLLRGYESASLLISIWFSAPLGIAIAEYMRRRGHRCIETDDSVTPTHAAPATV